MKATKQTAFIIAALLYTTTAQAADWNLPISISSGSAKTGVVLGISQNATNGFDAGLDSPTPFTDELLNAYFSHPEWNQVSAGAAVTAFHRDIRNSIPQNFNLTVKTSLSPATLTWDKAQIPATVQTTIDCNGTTLDMQKVATCTFVPATQITTTTISITAGDTTPPSAPANLSYAISGTTLQLVWEADQETDLAGYKLHLLDAQGNTTQTVNLKNVTNYNLMNIQADVPYRIALSAYDKTGNQSTYSTAITAIKVTPQPEPVPAPVPIPTPAPVPAPAPQPVPTIKANGDFNGDGVVNKGDLEQLLNALKNKHRNVSAAALARADMDGDGKLTKHDAVLIEKLIERQKHRNDKDDRKERRD